MFFGNEKNKNNEAPFIFKQPLCGRGDFGTWKESRKASSLELDDAEKSLNKLKALIGYCRPYDRQCHDALAAMEKCLSNVEKAAVAPPPQQSNQRENKMVSFGPEFYE